MIVSNARWACRSALALQTPSRVLAFSLVFAPLAVSSPLNRAASPVRLQPDRQPRRKPCNPIRHVVAF
jgi:hypothetical protein